MVLMKPTRKRAPGAGNAQPKKRQAFPEVDQDKLEDRLDLYIKKIGSKEAFNLYNYAALEAQQAEHPKSLVKLAPLIEALVDVNGEGKIKFKFLKQCLMSLTSRFGNELLGAHFSAPDKGLLPGKVADRLGVLHWRRVTGSPEGWQKLIKQLDECQSAVLNQIYKKMARNDEQGNGGEDDAGEDKPSALKPSGSKSRVLAPHPSDISTWEFLFNFFFYFHCICLFDAWFCCMCCPSQGMDSKGFPAMAASSHSDKVSVDSIFISCHEQ